MSEMSPDLMDLINSTLCYLATASKDGVPHAAPIGSIKTVSPDTIVMAVGFMKRSYQNMQENPRATILAHSPLPAPKGELSAAQLSQVSGARVKGSVNLLTSGELHEKMKGAMAERLGPEVAAMVRATAVIKVEEVYPITFGP